MESKFSWFPKLTKTLERVPEEQRADIAWALICYGTYDEEPDLAWPLDAIFESLRDDIDNSKRAIRDGGSGGRGNKKTEEQPSEKPSNDEGEHPFETIETVVSESEKGGFEEPEAKPIHTNTKHTKPVQDCRKRFKPPTQQEVAAYASERGHPEFPAQRFVDYHAQQGWKLSNGNPMKDWQATVRNWIARDDERRGEVRNAGDFSSVASVHADFEPRIA